MTACSLPGGPALPGAGPSRGGGLNLTVACGGMTRVRAARQDERVYPDDLTLLEVGRIAIAAGRLDAALGAIWWHLAPDEVDELQARSAPAGKARDKVKPLARQRLDQENADTLCAFIEEVKEAQEERNEVLHSRWLLRGPDSMRPVSEFLSLDDEQRLGYLEEWERESRRSDQWRLQRNRSVQLSEPLDIDRLVDIERRLSSAEAFAVHWHFRLASMRETGSPPGWRGPAEARQGPQPVPEGALTGEAAADSLNAFIERYRTKEDT